MTVLWVVILVATFCAMEAVAALEHRYAMHGFAWGWHRSHHQPRTGRFERNDRFPFVFAGVAIALFLAGTNVDALWWLVPVATGITLYGAVYFFVHDVYIHGRLWGHRLPRVAVLDRLADEHALHHRFNDAPYGMLVPVVPAEIRRRAAERPDDSGRRDRSGRISA